MVDSLSSEQYYKTGFFLFNWFRYSSMLDCLDQPRQLVFTTCGTATWRLKLGVIQGFCFDLAARATLNHSAAFRLTVRYNPDVECSPPIPSKASVESQAFSGYRP